MAEAKAAAIVVASVKAVEPAEEIGWAVLVQDVAGSRAAAIVVASVKAVEPAEAIG